MKVVQYEVLGEASLVAATVPLYYWRNRAERIRSELWAYPNHKSQSPFSVAVFSLVAAAKQNVICSMLSERCLIPDGSKGFRETSCRCGWRLRFLVG